MNTSEDYHTAITILLDISRNDWIDVIEVTQTVVYLKNKRLKALRDEATIKNQNISQQ